MIIKDMDKIEISLQTILNRSKLKEAIRKIEGLWEGVKKNINTLLEGKKRSFTERLKYYCLEAGGRRLR